MRIPQRWDSQADKESHQVQPTSSPPPDRSYLPSLGLEHLWPLGVISAIFIFLAIQPIRPHDFWWHLQGGQQLVITGRLPTGEGLSGTVPAPYANYATFWLMQGAFYLLYALGGPELIVFAHAVTITLAYGIILVLSRRAGGSWRIAAIGLLFAAALGFDDWNVRPQGIAFLLGALYLWTIDGYRRNSRRALLAIFPAGMLVWVNSHGSMVIGFLMLGIWLADELGQAAWRRLAQDTGSDLRRLGPPVLALSMTAVAALANPRGIGIVGYVSGLSGNPIIRTLVPEWAPPGFDSRQGALFLIALLLCSVLLAVSPRRPSLYQVLTFLAFGALALATKRGIVWFGMAMAPVVAQHLAALAAAWWPERSSAPGRVVVNYAVAVILLAGVVLALPWFKGVLPLPAFKREVVSPDTPVVATEYLLAEQLPGPLFNELGFGSYLIWAAHPAYPVFVDPRLELYPAPLWRDYLLISAGAPGWQEALDRYGANTLLVSPSTQAGLVTEADRSQAWRRVYQDPGAVIFVRASLPGRPADEQP